MLLDPIQCALSNCILGMAQSDQMVRLGPREDEPGRMKHYKHYEAWMNTTQHYSITN
jgi:hypothetical protein